jgi:FkbM family methyltransferase
VRLPILAGPLRGQWWNPASGGKVARVLAGTYEREQTRCFEERLQPGWTLFDVGAHVGYYTLLGAALVGRAGRVISFEPNARNNRFLRRHVAMNGLQQVSIEGAAVSDRAGVARFEAGSGSGTGHLAEHGGTEVPTVRLDDYCREFDLQPQAVKIDVEGAELKVLRGAESLLVTHHPLLFLSTHGRGVHDQCVAWLSGRGYDVRPITGASVHDATELICAAVVQ